MYVFVSQGVHI